MRKLKTAITMLVLIGILVAGAYYGWQGLGGSINPFSSEAEDSTRICTTPRETVDTGSVEVSIYNAGAPPGTATRVSEALRTQGFPEGVVANAPRGREVKGIVLWVADKKSVHTKLVRRQFRAAKVVERRNLPGKGVNVLVGDFTALAPKPPTEITARLEKTCEPA